jgi:hypothetical protein
VRFLAAVTRANARFELLDDKKLGYSDELSEQAEEEFKALLDTNWKDYKPDDDTLQDLRDKLEDIKKEAKRMAKTAKDKSAGHGLGLGKRAAEEKPSAKAGKMAKGGGEAPAVPERPVRKWEVKKAVEWLRTVGEEFHTKYKDAFTTNGVNGILLLDVIGDGGDTKEAHKELEYVIGVKSKIHRIAIIKAAQELREWENTMVKSLKNCD